MNKKTNIFKLVVFSKDDNTITKINNATSSLSILVEPVIKKNLNQLESVVLSSPAIVLLDQELVPPITINGLYAQKNKQTMLVYLADDLDTAQITNIMQSGFDDIIYKDQLHHLSAMITKVVAKKTLYTNKLLDNLFSLLDVASIGLGIYDKYMKLVQINNTAHQIFSPHLESIIGLPIQDISPDVVKSGRYERYNNTLNTGEPYTTEFYFTNIANKTYFLSIHAIKIGDGLGIITVDRTAQKETEIAIKTREEQMQSLVVGSTQPLCILDETGKILFLNHIAASHLNKKRSEILGKNLAEIIPSNTTSKALVNLIQTTIARNQSMIHETPVILNDQERIWLELRLYPIRSTEHDSQSVLIFINDITKRMENAEEHELLSQAINHTLELVLIANHRNHIKYINSTFEKKTGFKKSQVFGKPVFDYINSEYNKDILPAIWDKIKKGQEWSGNLFYHKSNYEIFEGESTFAPVVDKNGDLQYFINIIRDVTEEREMEKKLRQTQKMETIGTLAGGIAHDFNNILVPILGYSELLAERIAENENYRHYTEHIIKAGYRAKDLINQILTFSRKVEQEKRPIYLQTIIKEVLKLLRASIPSSIEIEQNIDPQCLTVLADPTQIHQVIMNLCVNAFHAMRDKGGKLKVSLQNIEFKEKQPNLKLNPGHYVMLTVADTGEGMGSEVLDRIFEPFFTTKNEQGTGLGLSVVHGIVISHDGEIGVHSEPGKGTQFTIYFPVYMEFVDTTEQNNVIPTGTESILFVDDEEEIVQLNEQILNQLGYTPTVTTDSVNALDIFKNNPNDFDLIFTDFTMPRMNGLSLAQEIRNLRPDIPIILCTGYSENVTEDNIKACGITEFVFKPLTMGSIAQIIRKALDSNI